LLVRTHILLKHTFFFLETSRQFISPPQIASLTFAAF
jgi:hypothetical protein